MCLIVFHPPNAKAVPIATLERAARSHPDGLGVMHAAGGKLHLTRFPPESVEAGLDYAVATLAAGSAAIHFRTATHGSIGLSNTHPIEVVPGVGLMHNGILTGGKETVTGASDTALFAQQVLRQLPRKWWRNAALCDLMGEAVGTFNKLLVMDATGYARIINEDHGVHDGGNWFSNASYLPPVSVYGGRWTGSGLIARAADVVIGWLVVGHHEFEDGIYCSSCAPITHLSAQPLSEEDDDGTLFCEACGTGLSVEDHADYTVKGASHAVLSL